MALIAYDARTLAGARSGIGRFLQGSLVALQEAAPQHEYCLFTNRPIRTELGVEGRLLAPWLPKQLWEAVALPLAAQGIQADVLHLPHEGFPGANRRIRRVVTLNDLIPMHFAEQYLRNAAHAAWYHRRLRAVQRHADVVITISQATADEVQAHLSIAADRIRVVRIPVDVRFKVDSKADSLVTSRFALERDNFFLALGTREPRKNLERVLQAHAMYAQSQAHPKPLVLFGHQWRGLSARDLIEKYGARGLVRSVGPVTDEELVALYNVATALVFPSTYEGYGLPVTEAMACGCPVITADKGALAEVAGRVAVLVDPASVPAITGALARLHDDAAEKARMSKDGLSWVTRESWFDASKSLLGAYGLE